MMFAEEINFLTGFSAG